jgi:predicted dehydrogenase
MKPTINTGVIGGSRHAQALVEYLAPLPRLRLARWAPSPGGGDQTGAAALARSAGVEFVPDWQAVAGETSLRAVLVLSDAPERSLAVEAALKAGKAVLCPAPAARTATELDGLADAIRRGHGLLLSPGAIRHTPAAKYALAEAAAGSLGRLHSVYAAARSAAQDGGNGGGVVDEIGWDIFDFVLGLTHAPVRRLHAAGAAWCEGAGGRDIAALIVRFDDELIATVELARCLPPGIAAEGEPEVEIEVIAARQALRIEPYGSAVRVHRPGGSSLRPWLDAPVVSMAQDLAEAIDSGLSERESLDPHRRLAEVMSRATGAVAGDAGEYDRRDECRSGPR